MRKPTVSLLLGLLLPFATGLAAAETPSPQPAPAADTAAANAQPNLAAPVTDNPGLPDLTIDECVTRALAHNFTLQIQNYSTANAQNAVAIAKSGFDTTFQLSSQRTYSQQAGASNSQFNGGASQPVVAADTTQLTATRKIITGGIFSLNSQLGRNRTNYAFTGTLNPAYNSDLSVSLTQPLLQGFGAAVNRAPIERSQLGVTIARLGYKGAVLQVIHDTEVAYYNLVFAREQLRVNNLSLGLAQQLYQDAQFKRKTGVATDLDVLTAQVAYANAQNAVVLAQKSVHDAEDSLLSLIGQFAFDEKLGSTRFPTLDEPAPSFGLSYKLALDNQPTYVSALAAIKQDQLDVKTTANGRLPNLALDGGVGYNSKDDSYASAINTLPERNGYNWQLGVSLSFPWGNHQQNALYRTAVNTLNQAKTNLEQIEQNMMVQVRGAIRAVETSLESVRLSELSTQLSEKQYGLQKAQFDAGLATSRAVLQALSDLGNARVAELQAKVSLRTAYANLYQIDGTLLQRFNVVVPDDSSMTSTALQPVDVKPAPPTS